MIPQLILQQQRPQWQEALRHLITCPLTLLANLELSPDEISWQWDRQFPVRVTPSFIARMKKGDPNDPLLRQVLSIKEEGQLSKNFHRDPLKEEQFNPLPGLFHKYASRVLLTFAPSCAVHCRYCFRRHFPYEDNTPGSKGWSEALTYIAQRPDIVEVILSGGDPLMAQDDLIGQFLEKLAHIPHVQIVRFHTRLPILIPERIHAGFIQMLKQTRFQIVFVYHINHSAEITSAIQDGVFQLKQANMTIFNASVLLKGVNDDPETLKQLSLSLFKAGILPYYVNLLDQVQGSSHFLVSREQAHFLQKKLREQLPGYLVPKFVQEIPHSPYKTPLDQL